MKYAQQLLEQTTLPVKQIANQTAHDLNLLLIQSSEPETDLLALEDFFIPTSSSVFYLKNF